ncbi:hypothetical protein I4U23_023019 [Adineta vaga]|nr:hypothetical protein I4U23_023019 [Adineta vaga]
MHHFFSNINDTLTNLPNLSFESFENLIKLICKQLQIFRSTSPNRTFFDTDERGRLRIRQQINCFTSSFWFERQSIVKIQINNAQNIIYLIQLRKQEKNKSTNAYCVTLHLSDR